METRIKKYIADNFESVIDRLAEEYTTEFLRKAVKKEVDQQLSHKFSLLGKESQMSGLDIRCPYPQLFNDCSAIKNLKVAQFDNLMNKLPSNPECACECCAHVHDVRKYMETYYLKELFGENKENNNPRCDVGKYMETCYTKELFGENKVNNNQHCDIDSNIAKMKSFMENYDDNNPTPPIVTNFARRCVENPRRYYDEEMGGYCDDWEMEENGDNETERFS